LLFASPKSPRNWHQMFDALALVCRKIDFIQCKSLYSQLRCPRIDTNDIIDKLLKLSTKSLILLYVAIEIEVYGHVLMDKFIRATRLEETLEMLVVVLNAVDVIFLIILVNKLSF
jgi:hypothetical protein